ncbi:MAG: hypothetical protein FWE69_00515 [Clostridiales bacterium]|nr:hypothetical protein [Clostridiales bacterium]
MTWLSKTYPRALGFAFVHFAVDLGCAFLIFRLTVSPMQGLLALLLYNFCAFAMQLPFGILIDRFGFGRTAAALGCALVALSAAFAPLPLLCAIAAGLGNALFHVGGAVCVMDLSASRLGPLGVFVSTGAVGLYLGGLLAKATALPSLYVVLLLLSCAAALGLHARRTASSPAAPATETFPIKALLPACLLFLAVALRSFAGFVPAFPWKAAAPWGHILVLCVAGGKALGGLLSDRFGVRLTAALSLTLALFCFAPGAFAPLGVVGFLLFNMTMPITLYGLTRLFPRAKGAAFGALTFALFLGYLPAFLGLALPLPTAVILTLAAGATLLLLWPVARLWKR